MDSAAFYDDYVTTQVKSGVNDRIIGLFSRLKRLSIRSNTSVLEIGCGIGTLTSLLLRRIKSGRIEAIDLSPKSIEFAQRHLKAPNLLFSAVDILRYEPGVDYFDRILLFDVLEHIPLELHAEVFQRIRKWMQNDSLLLINLPNPGYIEYDRENNPAALQEIDQPVYLSALAGKLAIASLDITDMETYSVWVKDDYQFLVVRKRKKFEEKKLSDSRTYFQKGIVWLKRKVWKLSYPFPKEK